MLTIDPAALLALAAAALASVPLVRDGRSSQPAARARPVVSRLARVPVDWRAPRRTPR